MPSQSGIAPPWLKMTFAPLAVSITEPPPTASKLSAPASCACAAHVATPAVPRSLGLDLAPGEGDGHVHLSEPEPVRRIGLHRHRHLRLHVRLPAVHVTRLALLEAHRDRRLRVAVLVADDCVRLAELRRQLLVLSEILEQLADRVVDLLGVLEVGQV